MTLPVPAAKPVKLTHKQEMFCRFYLKHRHNGSKAYRLAYDSEGMKENTVNREAWQLLQNPKITARLEQLRAAAMARAGLAPEDVVNMILDDREDAKDDKNHNAVMKADELLGKTLNLFSEDRKANGQPIQINLNFGGKVNQQSTKFDTITVEPVTSDEDSDTCDD